MTMPTNQDWFNSCNYIQNFLIKKSMSLLFKPKKEGNSAPKFRAVELKVPSLAKVEDGEIFDDLDDDSDFQVGARVASAEITDMVRKSQIMDLNKSN